MNKSILAAFLFVMLSMPVFAEKIARVSLGTLFREASIVAVVKIESAHQLPDGCGVRYSALVVDGLKGAQKGTAISVSDRYLRSAGLNVGKTFVLFAIDNASCGPVVSHAGYGALLVESPLLVDYAFAVRIPHAYVELPSSLPIKPGQRRDEESTEVAWVEMKALLDTIKSSGDDGLGAKGSGSIDR